MRKPQGYATLFEPDFSKECDTFTCGHCNGIVHVPPKADPTVMGGLCKQCMKLICPKCVERMTCTPWERQMQIMENRDAALRSYGLRD